MVQFINHPNWVAQVVFWFVLSRSLFRNHWWPRDIPVQLSVLLSSGRSHFKILLKILMKHIIKTFLKDEIDKWMIIIIKLIINKINAFNRYRRKRPKVDTSVFDTVLSHTRRSDASEKKKKNTCVYFWTFSPVDKFRVLACIG